MGQISLKEVTFAAGQSVSAPVNLDAQGIATFQIPTNWTEASLTAQLSHNRVDWFDFQDSNGSEIVLLIRAGQAFDANVSVWGKGLLYVRFRSGTADAPVEQAESVSITLLVRSFS